MSAPTRSRLPGSDVPGEQVPTTKGPEPASATFDLTTLARVGTALSDDTRRQILVALLGGPAYPSELAETLELTRPNVSNHLSCLRGCGLVVADPEGRRQRYRLSDPRLSHALEDLCSLVLDPAQGCEHDPDRR